MMKTKICKNKTSDREIITDAITDVDREIIIDAITHVKGSPEE